MARMRDLQRVRRRRAAMSIGSVIAVMGVSTTTGSVIRGDIAQSQTLVGAGIAGIGFFIAWVAAQGYQRAADADHADLERAGSWDSMPPGAEVQGDTIGLRTMTLWSVFIFTAGMLMLLFGALLALASESDQAMLIAGLGILVLSLVMFVLWSWVRGTVLWLDADGIRQARFPHAHVRWEDIEKVEEEPPAGLLLRAPGKVDNAGKKKNKFRIGTRSLEISRWDLIDLIGSVSPQAEMPSMK